MYADPLRNRCLALEELYFRSIEEHGLRNLRRASSGDRRRKDFAEALRVEGPSLLDCLEELGMISQTVPALGALPFVELAWAEGVASASGGFLGVRPVSRQGRAITDRIRRAVGAADAIDAAA